MAGSPRIIAIVDMGTNTFNLLIAAWTPTPENPTAWTPRFASKIPVKLGEGGIHQGIITAAAEERAIAALKQHRKSIDEHRPDAIFCSATSAMRDASNGPQIQERIAREIGLDITVISGDREAELIFKGVMGSVPAMDQPLLIMDIGGGSTEFIIGHGDQLLWKRSYPLGVSRLLELLRPSDPATPSDFERLYHHLDEAMVELYEACDAHQPTVLVGSSGSFDTLRDVIHGGLVSSNTNANYYTFQPEALHHTLNHLMHLSTAERLKVPGMIPLRAEMMGVGCAFIKHVLVKLDLERILQSDYALKEGVLMEWIKSQQHG